MNYALIDLHLHLDGSLSLQTVRELAHMQGIEIAREDEELKAQLQVGEDCRDLNEYLEKFSLAGSLLQTRGAITKAVQCLEQELKAQGLLYAEIRFAPQKHLEQGLTQDQVVEAAIRGMGQCDFHSNLILCCMRERDNLDQNLETVRVAHKYLGQGVCAVDLAGAEALYPTEHFKKVFELAAQLGVPYTIHAGEADGPESVKTALAFGAKRIGHGVRSVEDQALVKRLAAEGITLELCPTSNLNTNIYKRIEDYPLPALLDAGVRVTINTDNMTVSGTSLKRELQLMAETFGLTGKQLYFLAKNAVDASFADAHTKEWLKKEIESRAGMSNEKEMF